MGRPSIEFCPSKEHSSLIRWQSPKECPLANRALDLYSELMPEAGSLTNARWLEFFDKLAQEIRSQPQELSRSGSWLRLNTNEKLFEERVKPLLFALGLYWSSGLAAYVEGYNLDPHWSARSSFGLKAKTLIALPWTSERRVSRLEMIWSRFSREAQLHLIMERAKNRTSDALGGDTVLVFAEDKQWAFWCNRPCCLAVRNEPSKLGTSEEKLRFFKLFAFLLAVVAVYHPRGGELADIVENRLSPYVEGHFLLEFLHYEMEEAEKRDIRDLGNAVGLLLGNAIEVCQSVAKKARDSKRIAKSGPIAEARAQIEGLVGILKGWDGLGPEFHPDRVQDLTFSIAKLLPDPEVEEVSPESYQE